MRFRVRYHRPVDLVGDYDGQIAKGGLFVAVSPPAPPALYQRVDLELVLPDGTSVEIATQVLQFAAGAGVALGFDARGLGVLVEAVAAARAQPSPPGARSVESSLVDESAAASDGAARAATARRDTVAVRGEVGALSGHEKIQRALHGDRDERTAILRDVNRTAHPYVLRNPGIQLDEVLAIAKMTTLAADVLKAIADRPEWSRRPEIALALVRNPKTPVPSAVALLDRILVDDLRRLAKDPGTRPPIQAAARKKVIG